MFYFFPDPWGDNRVWLIFVQIGWNHQRATRDDDDDDDDDDGGGPVIMIFMLHAVFQVMQ